MTEFISQFDFNLVYRPGVENQEADCLSHNPVIESTQEISKVSLIKTKCSPITRNKKRSVPCSAMFK